MTVPYKSWLDFAHEMYRGCCTNNRATWQVLASKYSTWFTVLYTVFTFIPASQVSNNSWQSGLCAVLEKNHIDCIPGSNQSRLTIKQVVQLVRNTAPPSCILAARPGSLKCDAIEVVLWIQEQWH